MKVHMPEKHSYVSMIPSIWKYIKGPIKAVHDWVSPIPEDDEYGLLRRNRQELYDNMYSHLDFGNSDQLVVPNFKIDTPVDSLVNSLDKIKNDVNSINKNNIKPQNPDYVLSDREIYEDNVI